MFCARREFYTGEIMDNNNAPAGFDVSPGQKFYRMPDARFDLYGVFYDENEGRFLRMTQSVANAVSPSVAELCKNTAGGRIRFRTDATRISVAVKCGNLASMPHIPLLGSHGLTLVEDDGGDHSFAAAFMPFHYANLKESVLPDGFYAEKSLPGGRMRAYTLYLPLFANVSELTIGLPEEAKVENGLKYRPVKPILYYGSSITHGGCASRPDNSYECYISKWLDVDFINLGFSGSALGEVPIAEYIASLDPSVFVCDYDYNAPGPEHLKETHYRLYRIFREKHPDTPIIFITNPDWDTDASSEARLKVIRETVRRARRAGDENIGFVSGKKLFGALDREHCTVDMTHPNDLGFYRMAQEIVKALKKFI